MSPADGTAWRSPRLLVLGAGFSQPAGLPLTDTLLQECLARARSVIGAPNKLDRSLEDYRMYVAATGVDPDAPVDIELFVEYLDHAHTLQLRGSDTWSDEGNEDQLMMRWALGAVIHAATPPLAALPDVYIEFARRLRPGDCVVTFNYDLILEEALRFVGTPFRRFPMRYTGVHLNHCDGGDPRDDEEVLILKLHGSIDWVDRTSFDGQTAHSELERDVYGLDTTSFRDRNVVFGTSPLTRTRPLIEGARPGDDPLARVMVMEGLDDYYSSRWAWNAAPPLVLAPSQAKLLYGRALREFWRGLPGFGWGWRSFGIVGYSLPPADRYVRQMLYGLARGYGVALADQDGYPGGPRPSIKVVDLRTGAGVDELQEQYRFLPDGGVDFLLDGFGVYVLDDLFASR